MFNVELVRNLNGTQSSITIEVCADNRDEAVAKVEGQMFGWRTANVEPVKKNK